MTALAPLTAAAILCWIALLGLAVGSFLNVVVYRVPVGVSLLRESRCPSCGEPVRAWQNVPVLSWVLLRGKCATCSAPISVRYPLVEAFTALAFVGVASAVLGSGMQAGFAEVLVLAAYLGFAAVCIALSLIDIDTGMLPRAIVRPTLVGGLGTLAVAAAVAGDAQPLGRGVVGAAALWMIYAVIRFIRPDGLGGGDVAFAPVVGLFTGFVGWGALVVGAFAAFLGAGVFGLALILTRRARRGSPIAFGPWMVVGAWVGILAGNALADWYLGALVG